MRAVLLTFIALVRAFPGLPVDVLSDEKVTDVSGIGGRSTTLPCPLNPREDGDSAKLVLWYKREIKTPLFSYDGRQSSYENKIYRENGQLIMDAFSAKLTLTSLSVVDGGLYECRVDFFKSPTQTNLVNLTVLEPPYSVEIFDKQLTSAVKDVLGPYREGESIILACLAKGGTPKPAISWRSENTPLTNTSPPVEGVNPSIVQSDLFLTTLSREWHKRIVTCEAHNSDMLQPVMAHATINMHLLPTSVHISHFPPTIEGSKAILQCISRGSLPPAHLEWLIGDQKLSSSDQNETKGRLTTSSRIMINATRFLNEKEIICRATNPKITKAFVENSTTIVVNYPPTVKILLGPSLNPALLKEGDDLYFECIVDANPKPDTITWFHELKSLEQNIRKGILLSGNSLVLQKVSRQRAGKYRCSASNSLGKVTSTATDLKLRYVPECVSSPTTHFIYNHPINVTCSVYSYPHATLMHWRWNGGSDIMNIRPFSSGLERTMRPQLGPNGRASSTLAVKPAKNSEDRELSCWAENEMGRQKKPCIYAIKVAKIPAPLSSCRFANITASSLSLLCEQSVNLEYENTLYMAELYWENMTMYTNFTSKLPIFNLGRLDPETNYQIKVYVLHGPVTSPPVTVSASTFRRSRVEASTSGSSIRSTSTLNMIVGSYSILLISLAFFHELTLFQFCVHDGCQSIYIGS